MNDIIKYEIIPYMDLYDILNMRINKEITQHIYFRIKKNKHLLRMFTEIFDNPKFYQRFENILCIKYMNLFITLNVRNIDTSYLFSLGYDFNILSNDELMQLLNNNNLNMIKYIKYYLRTEKLKLKFLETQILNYHILNKYYPGQKYLNHFIDNSLNTKITIRNIDSSRIEKYKYVERYLNDNFKLIQPEKYYNIVNHFHLSDYFLYKMVQNYSNKYVLIRRIFSQCFISEKYINKFLELIDERGDGYNSIWRIIWNQKLSENFIKKNYDKIDWNYDSKAIIYNELSFEFIKKIFPIIKKKMDESELWYRLFKHSIIPIDFINNEIPIFNKILFGYLLYNEKLSIEYLKQFMKYLGNEVFFETLKTSRYPIPEYFIEEYIDRFDINHLCTKNNFSKEFIMRHINKIGSLTSLRNHTFSLKEFNEIKELFIQKETQKIDEN
jgi:hypothetical protein